MAKKRTKKQPDATQEAAQAADPEIAPSPGDQTFHEAIEERVAALQKDAETVDTLKEKKVLRRIEASYRMDRLGQRVETLAELAQLQLNIEALFEGDIDPDAAGLRKSPSDATRDISAMESMLRKEEAENVINTFGDLADILEGVETVEDLATLSADQLIALESKHEGILLYAFTDFVNRKKKIDWAQFESFYQKPKPGRQLQIDFRGNASAEAEIGASDILPPSVRCITVYESGDKNRARTSVRRLGLKGRNQPNQGFFDNDGYMAIYSGDVVVIGGAKNSQKGIDYDFEARFRKPDGSLDFDKYDRDAGPDGKTEEQKDADFLAELLARNPRARTRKKLTVADVEAMMRDLDTTSNGRTLVAVALREVQRGRIKGRHCWDWVDKIYKKAGMKHRRTYQNLNYPGKDSRAYFAAHPEENAHRKAKVMQIEPGDWIYINNRNRIDRKGGHSVLVTKVIVPGKKLEVANCKRGGTAGVLSTYDIEDMPVTHISKPVPR